MTRAGTGGVHIEFWWGNMKERDHPKDMRVDGMMTSK